MWRPLKTVVLLLCGFAAAGELTASGEPSFWDGSPGIATQPSSEARSPGESVTLSVSAVGTKPLTYQWWKDGMLLPGEIGPVFALENLQGADAGTYHVAVENLFGATTSDSAVLTVNLAGGDETFVFPLVSRVYSLAVQSDGRILTVGEPPVARLNADGSGDGSFRPRVWGMYKVILGSSLAVQPDGRILLSGLFHWLSEEPHDHIGRLNADGSVDSSFKAEISGEPHFVAVDGNEKILVIGGFRMPGSQRLYSLARLNSDGTIDRSFSALGALAGWPSGQLGSLAFQADGKILLGGSFTHLAGEVRHRIARLNADGTLDRDFNPGANGPVFSLVVQPDGRILMGGRFSEVADQQRDGLARLNPDGTLDMAFNPAGDGDVSCLGLQADGKILVGVP